jgi:recombination endonuclease VII
MNRDDEAKEARRLRRNEASRRWCKNNPDKIWRKKHPELHNAASKAWNNAHKERRLEITAAWRKTHPDHYVTSQERRAGRKKPKKCEVCNRVGKICFDHCHRSDKFRGWICDDCNVALGRMNDSPKLLRKLLTYAENFSKPVRGKKQ